MILNKILTNIIFNSIDNNILANQNELDFSGLGILGKIRVRTIDFTLLKDYEEDENLALGKKQFKDTFENQKKIITKNLFNALDNEFLINKNRAPIRQGKIRAVIDICTSEYLDDLHFIDYRENYEIENEEINAYD